MGMTNYERVAKALELLKEGFGSFVQREIENTYQDQAQNQANQILGDDWLHASKSIEQLDAAALLKLMWNTWNDGKITLYPALYGIVYKNDKY